MESKHIKKRRIGDNSPYWVDGGSNRALSAHLDLDQPAQLNYDGGRVFGFKGAMNSTKFIGFPLLAESCAYSSRWNFSIPLQEYR